MTAIEELRENIQNAINTTKDFPDIGFKRGYESCTEVILIALNEVIDKEKALQAKHEEEKKQAIILAYFDGFINAQDKVIELFKTRKKGNMHLTKFEAEQYYEQLTNPKK